MDIFGINLLFLYFLSLIVFVFAELRTLRGRVNQGSWQEYKGKMYLPSHCCSANGHPWHHPPLSTFVFGVFDTFVFGRLNQWNQWKHKQIPWVLLWPSLPWYLSPYLHFAFLYLVGSISETGTNSYSFFYWFPLKIIENWISGVHSGKFPLWIWEALVLFLIILFYIVRLL